MGFLRVRRVMRLTRNWVAEGDSITAAGGSGYATKTSINMSPLPDVYTNKAVGGSGVPGLVSRAASVDALLLPNARNVLSVFIGTNDNANASFLPDLAAYCDARRAAGWYLILMTLLPNMSNLSGRATCNTEMRLWTTSGSTIPGKHADAICDFGADEIMGVDGARDNTTYYSDTVHPTNATYGTPNGHDRLMTEWSLPSLNAAFAGY